MKVKNFGHTPGKIIAPGRFSFFTEKMLTNLPPAQKAGLLALLFYAVNSVAQTATLPASSVAVPFFLAGNHVVIQAAAAGQTGNYIIDTGSPDLILNSRYSSGLATFAHHEEVEDIYGNTSASSSAYISQIVVNETAIHSGNAVVIDLTGLESAKGIPIAGIIGYSTLKNYEWMLDFELQQLFLFDRKNESACSFFDDAPTDSLDFKMSGHIPFVMARMGNKMLRMGMDTGAEVNVLHPQALKNQVNLFTPEGRSLLTGMKGKKMKQSKGFVSSFSIGKQEDTMINVVLADLRNLNHNLDINLDGILGSPFLMQKRVAINYQREKIYFWSHSEPLFTKSKDYFRTE